MACDFGDTIAQCDVQEGVWWYVFACRNLLLLGHARFAAIIAWRYCEHRRRRIDIAHATDAVLRRRNYVTDGRK